MKIQIYDFNRNGRTHKSLGINEVVDDAVQNGVDTISLISSGNFIRTLLGEIRQRGLENIMRVVNLSNRQMGLDCLELDIKHRRVLRDSAEREQYVRETLPNCGNVKDYTDFTPRAYELKAEEILETNPNYVSLGVGSGKLFLALRKIIQEKGLNTKLIGILPKGENGVFNDDNLYNERERLYYKKFEPKSLADKLVCPYAYYKPELLKVREEGHVLIEVEDKDFKKANKKARKSGLEAEVSGSAGFVILDPKIRKQYGIPEDSSVVIVNTGRGYEWENQLKRENRRNWLVRGLIAGATAVSLLIGGWIYSQVPSAEELKYADLNGDGVVSSEEIYHCHLMTGAYDWNTKNNFKIDRKTLTKIKELKEKLANEVIGRYHSDYKAMERAFDNQLKIDDISDLSFNQLDYLDERAKFRDFSAPEFYRWRLSRHMQLHKQGIDIPVWDVR